MVGPEVAKSTPTQFGVNAKKLHLSVKSVRSSTSSDAAKARGRRRPLYGTDWQIVVMVRVLRRRPICARDIARGVAGCACAARRARSEDACPA
jgi:hypothetical protein